MLRGFFDAGLFNFGAAAEALRRAYAAQQPTGSSLVASSSGLELRFEGDKPRKPIENA